MSAQTQIVTCKNLTAPHYSDFEPKSQKNFFGHVVNVFEDARGQHTVLKIGKDLCKSAVKVCALCPNKGGDSAAVLGKVSSNISFARSVYLGLSIVPDTINLCTKPSEKKSPVDVKLEAIDQIMTVASDSLSCIQLGQELGAYVLPETADICIPHALTIIDTVNTTASLISDAKGYVDSQHKINDLKGLEGRQLITGQNAKDLAQEEIKKTTKAWAVAKDVCDLTGTVVETGLTLVEAGVWTAVSEVAKQVMQAVAAFFSLTSGVLGLAKLWVQTEDVPHVKLKRERAPSSLPQAVRI